MIVKQSTLVCVSERSGVLQKKSVHVVLQKRLLLCWLLRVEKSNLFIHVHVHVYIYNNYNDNYSYDYAMAVSQGVSSSAGIHVIIAFDVVNTHQALHLSFQWICCGSASGCSAPFKAQIGGGRCYCNSMAYKLVPLPEIKLGPHWLIEGWYANQHCNLVGHPQCQI